MQREEKVVKLEVAVGEKTDFRVKKCSPPAKKNDETLITFKPVKLAKGCIKHQKV